MRTAYVPAGPAPLAYCEQHGPGPTLFFVHGNSSAKESFEPQFGGPLAERFRLLAIDLPGHGDSARSSDGYSIEGFARILHDAAVALDAEDAVFVGHSLGGHLLIQAAPLLPKASGLMIFGTPPLSKPPSMEGFLPNPAAGLFFKADLTDGELGALAAACVAPDAEPPPQIADNARKTDPAFRVHLAQCVAGGQYQDEPAVLAGLDAPVGILHGSEDQLINGAYLDRLQVPSLWNASVHRIDGAGHYPQMERPDQFNALLASFVEELSPKLA